MKKILKNPILMFVLGLIVMATVVGVYAVSANEITYNNTTVKDALDELYNRKSYISLDRTYLESGTLVGNTVITENNPDSIDGLSITGAAKVNNIIANRWDKEIDLTNVSYLSFYARNGAYHGAIKIMVDYEQIYFLSYSDINSEWKKHLVNLDNYTGTHTLSICGGWGDSTGNSSSNTQYYDIRLVR